jgi:hypothetical protein
MYLDAPVYIWGVQATYSRPSPPVRYAMDTTESAYRTGSCHWDVWPTHAFVAPDIPYSSAGATVGYTHPPPPCKTRHTETRRCILQGGLIGNARSLARSLAHRTRPSPSRSAPPSGRLESSRPRESCSGTLGLYRTIGTHPLL